MRIGAALVVLVTALSLSAAEMPIEPPTGAAFVFTSNNGPMAFSHDGKRLVFIAASGGKNILFIRALDSIAARPVAGTDGAYYPFWSPDGRYLGFFADGKLKTVSTSAGGAVTTLCDAPRPRGGTWNRHGTIVFASGAHDPLRSISDTGGPPVAVTRLDAKTNEYSHRFPWFLPDGRHFLFLAQYTGGASRSTICAGALGSDEKTVIASANSPAVYDGEGHLLFLRGLTLVKQRFDLKRLRVNGEAKVVADGIQYFPNTASAMFSAANDGTTAYHRGPGRLARFAWIDLNGREIGTIQISGNAQLPRISHRGDRVVYSVGDPVSGSDDLWIVGASGGEPKRLTNEAGNELWPAWSPDDSQIVYSSDQQQGFFDLVVTTPSGTQPAAVLHRSPAVEFVNDWSRDGRYVLFQQAEQHSASGWDIYAVEVKTKSVRPVLQSKFNETGAAFSPDGQWIAYSSDATGRNELYVKPFTGADPERKLTTRGGSEPQWSGDGRAIYFRDGGDNMSRVDVETSPAFRASDPVVLFPLRARWLDIGGRQWDLAGDGQKLLEAELIPEAVPAPITVVVNGR